MAKAAVDHLWHDRSDYVLALGIGVALPILRATLDAILFKVCSCDTPPPPPVHTIPLRDPRGAGGFESCASHNLCTPH